MMANLKSSIRAFVDRNTSAVWDIAIAKFDESLNISEVNWIRNDFQDRWFADPFILQDSEKETILLVEDYVYGSFKATLSKLVVDKTTMRIVDRSSILELDTHLSFPFIRREGSDIFVIPENGKSGRLTSYRLTNGKLEKNAVLFERPIADAVLYESKGSFYIFCTEQFRCNGNVLTVLASDSPFGKYEKTGEITLNDNTARSAGAIFKSGDKIIRPAQVCNNDYGEALCFQELIEFSEGQFSLEEVRRISPVDGPATNGIHTFNVAEGINGLAVIDGFHYNTKIFRKAYGRFLEIKAGAGK